MLEEININIIPVKGYSRKEAFDQIKTFRPNIIKGANSTQAWIAAGKPIFGTQAFKQFCYEQLVRKTNCATGLGCYIIVENAISDTRTKPCKIIKLKEAKGTKKYLRVHSVHEITIDPRTNDIISIGPQITTFTTLAAATEAVKELTCATKKNYIVQTIKVPDFPTEVLSIYTPSCQAKIGTYIAFGIDE